GTCLFSYSCLYPIFVFFFIAPATTVISTLSLHDALPICRAPVRESGSRRAASMRWRQQLQSCPPAVPSRVSPGSISTTKSRLPRSEEHTSELQSRENLVCRLLLEKKKT